MKEYPEKEYSRSEADVPEYSLPDVLLSADSKRVATAAEWMHFQRDYILSMLKKYEYGELLPRPCSMEVKVLNEKKGALGGIATRKELEIRLCSENGKEHHFIMLLYQPSEIKQPVPAFLGLNFKGNHSTTDEKDVIMTGKDFVPREESARGSQSERWCFKECLSRGYASATVCYHDIFPDVTGHEDESVFKLFMEKKDYPFIAGKYSVIGAWAWGLSRALDALETLSEIDSSRVAVHGHSRLGKTSLWAGGTDQRFAMIISNDSGCGGGALHRRKFGENISQHFKFHDRINVPRWFVSRLEEYVWKEELLPIDQHFLTALSAPRPLVFATADLDLAADPKGEFLNAVAVSEVYRLFGSKGLPVKEMPPSGGIISGDVSFHLRKGVHDQTLFDWEHYFDLADLYLKRDGSGR